MRGFTSMQTPFWTVRHSLQFTTLGSVRWKVLWPTAATFQGLSLGVLQVSGSCCNTTHVSTTCLLAYKVSKRAASCRELAKLRSNCSWGNGRDRRNARRLIGSVIREEGLTYLQNWLSPSSKRTRTATGGAATNTAAWRCCRWRTSHACCSEAPPPPPPLRSQPQTTTADAASFRTHTHGESCRPPLQLHCCTSLRAQQGSVSCSSSSSQTNATRYT